MAYANLSVVITDAQKTEVLNHLQGLKNALNFFISLSDEERKKMRKVGTKRSAYVKDVLAVAKQNTQHIPASIDLIEFEKDAKLYLDLSEIVIAFLSFYEGLQDTLMASGNESIQTGDQIYAILKAASRKNANLKESLKIIAKHFEGQGKKKKGGNS